MAKLIFITGGVVSSLGKGIASASIGALMESHGYKISLMKLDPYINVDPGTMSPFQHGEVYVTPDGAETDLDLGHYERFTNAKISRLNNVTSGQIYYSVIQKEREGKYLGKTIQVVPHITDEIKNRIMLLTKKVDILICEIGGTVGDIESLPFLEAIRQLRFEHNVENTVFVHLTLVPFIRAAGELKTKPTQHSVANLREIGIQPQILLCRTEKPISQDMKEKIALFCNVKKQAVIEAIDTPYIYEIPLTFHRQNLDKILLEHLKLPAHPHPSLERWNNIVNILHTATEKVRIAVVGKYIKLQDSYKSIYEAIVHGAISNRCRVELVKIDSEQIEKDGPEILLKEIDGVVLPGGFGVRGVDGMIKTIKYCRENQIPFLGICLGLQCSVIEFARNVIGLKEANSTEFCQHTPDPVICLLDEQKSITKLGGTMRLGSYPCIIEPRSLASKVYKKKKIYERHRHRWEFNIMYLESFKKHGMKFTGFSPDRKLVEIIEIENHPFFIATQFHPEFQSKPFACHPLFSSFVNASLQHKGKEKPC